MSDTKKLLREIAADIIAMTTGLHDPEKGDAASVYGQDHTIGTLGELTDEAVAIITKKLGIQSCERCGGMVINIDGGVMDMKLCGCMGSASDAVAICSAVTVGHWTN